MDNKDTLEYLGFLRLGLELIPFWKCNSCGTMYPGLVPMCNSIHITKCLCKKNINNRLGHMNQLKRELEIRIEQLENELLETRNKLLTLNDIKPYSRPGAVILDPRDSPPIVKDFPDKVTIAKWICYPTHDQAVWQMNSERVNRKAQRLMLLLNPVGWIGDLNECWTLHSKNVLDIEVPLSKYKFYSNEIRNEAQRQIGDDIQYLNWYNSPEFRDGKQYE